MTRWRWLLPFVLAGSATGILATASVSGGTPDNSTIPSISPLAEYLGFGHDPTADEARYQLDEERRQRIISECMRNEGFSYTPQHGDVLITEDMTNAEIDAAFARADRDPNRVYRDTLSASALDSYYVALYGIDGHSESLTDAALKAYDLNGDGMLTGRENWARGCVGYASGQVPGVFYAAKVLRPQLSQLEAQVKADPRHAAAEKAWVACMNAAGVPGFDRVEMYRAAEIQPDQTDSRSTYQAIFDAIEPTCTAQYSAALEVVRLTYEADFVEENRAVLETLGVKR